MGSLYTVANLGCWFVALEYVTNWDSLRVPMVDMLICDNSHIVVHLMIAIRTYVLR